MARAQASLHALGGASGGVAVKRLRRVSDRPEGKLQSRAAAARGFQTEDASTHQSSVNEHISVKEHIKF
jgi:hypothetical protein